MGNKQNKTQNSIQDFSTISTGKKYLFQNFVRKKLPLVFPTISPSVLVLSPLLFFLAGRLSREFLGGRVMSDIGDRDPEAAGRCPPYSEQIPSARFSAPHLSLLVLSTEDVSSLFPGELVVSSPPTTSPFHDWMISGVPETFVGPLLHSMAFNRHLSRRGSDNRFSYKPQFFVRATSTGVPPFLIAMQHERFSSACEYATRPALGRSVIHVDSLRVQPFLNAGSHAPPEWETPTDWLFEVLTKQLVIPGRRLNRRQLADLDFPAPFS